MTKVVKTKTLKTGKPAGKVVKPKAPVAVAASAKPKYFKALDLLMAAVAHVQKGQPNRAVKALADASQDPDIDQAMEALNEQQQQAIDADQEDFAQDDLVIDQDDQAMMSKTLARLIRNSQQAETAAADDEDDEEEDEDDEDEQSEESSAETAGEDGEQSDDDLDISVDEDDEDEEQEQEVQASVTARLQRAARNKSRRP